MTMDTKTDEIERWVVLKNSYSECLAMPMSVFAVISPSIELLSLTSTGYDVEGPAYEINRKPFTLDVLPVGGMETMIAKHRMLPVEHKNTELPFTHP